MGGCAVRYIGACLHSRCKHVVFYKSREVLTTKIPADATRDDILLADTRECTSMNSTGVAAAHVWSEGRSDAR